MPPRPVAGDLYFTFFTFTLERAQPFCTADVYIYIYIYIYIFYSRRVYIYIFRITHMIETWQILC